MAVTSGSEMRDVIGARNLHIIDVADVENEGVRKPFGRVFYTEGKSLIFYAYDLTGSKGKRTFFAWGHRDGDPHTPHALGVLHNDDPAQGRWAFRCNDAKVLAQIDSVYVTLEPTDKPGDKPRGKKLLNAFLERPRTIHKRKQERGRSEAEELEAGGGRRETFCLSYFPDIFSAGSGTN